jgi:hypothetical protein
MGLWKNVLAIAVALIIVLLAQRYQFVWSHRLRWIVRQRSLMVALAGLLALIASIALSLLGHLPEPKIHDEFSYLLAADTFAHGRLSNPPHLMWMHFESFHIIQQPTYASKYPPAQGLILAGGQVIGGHPIVGVWMSTALACAAMSWMLLAWLPPQWAGLGALLVALHPGIALTWGQSYWGGAVAAMGGALVFGAIRRIMRRPRVSHALLMGLGLAVLANSRPYEGVVVSIPVGVLLLTWILGKNGPPAWVSLTRIVLPMLIVLTLTAGAMGFYNLRITGNPLRMPYSVHESTYGIVPVFIWQPLRPEPIYRYPVMRDFYTDWALKPYLDQQSILGLLKIGRLKLGRLWKFYLSPAHFCFVLTIPFVMLPWILKDRWPRFALLTCSILILGLLMETWMHPHYTAPAASLVFVLLLQAMRHLRLWRLRGKPIGQLLVWLLVVLAIASFMEVFVREIWAKPRGWQFQRAHIGAQLAEKGGHHLVIVRYGSLHSVHQEWVYNTASIDQEQVVWARELDAMQNRTLLEYFKDRQVWLVEVDQDQGPPRLMPYPQELRLNHSGY